MESRDSPEEEEEEEEDKSVSRRSALKTFGVAGLAGGLGFFAGDQFGPTALSVPGLGGRGPRGPGFVVFREGDVVYAQNGNSGGIDFQGAATDVLESVAASLSSAGGGIFVKRGTYDLSQTFPSADPPGPLLVAGEGESTLLRNGGQPFDAVDLTRLQGRDFQFEDLNGVLCSTSLTANLFNQTRQSLPFDTRGGEILPNSEVTRLGNYIRVRTTAEGSFPGISTGLGVYNRMAADRSLRIRATVRLVPPSRSAVPFFGEPFKGDFPNFFGFLWSPPDDLSAITRLGGTETRTPVLTSEALMTGDHQYEIEYTTGAVRFFFDGEFFAEHTSNISPPPHEWSAAEPNGTVMSCYLKHPFLEVVTV